MAALSSPRRVAAAAPLLLLAVWLYAIRTLLDDYGLFAWVAFDFGVNWGVARLFVLHGAAAAYDLPSLGEQLRPLAAYYGPEAGALQWGPFAYPPVLLLLLAPFAALPPLGAYLLWTAVNVLLAAHVIWRLAARLGSRRLPVTVAALCFYPLVDALLQGQVAVLLLYALYRAYAAFERGQEGRAGLWAGLLLLKPHYAVGLALVLLLKRRRRALAGLAATGAVLAGASLALLGPTGLPVYMAAIGEFSGFRATHPTTMPHLMINWRALLVNFLPLDFPEAGGALLAGALGAVTLGALALAWRGPWRPDAPSFAPRVLATLLATLLASPHSHVHGATLLLVPGLALAAQGLQPSLLRAALRASVFLPPPLLAVSMAAQHDLGPAGAALPALHTPIVFLVLLLACFGALIAQAVPPWRGATALPPAPLLDTPAG